jgi:hypothetical protein
MCFLFAKKKTTREILDERDYQKFSGWTSPKALEAREIAKHDMYFLPYFMLDGEKGSEESDLLGYLFGHPVLKVDDLNS